MGDVGLAACRPAAAVPRVVCLHPEQLLDRVEARPLLARVEVVDAGVDARVEVAEGLGDGLDRLVGLARRGEQRLSRGDVARPQRLREGVRARDEQRRLAFQIAAVGGDARRCAGDRPLPRAGHDQRGRPRPPEHRSVYAPGCSVSENCAVDAGGEVLGLGQDAAAVEDLVLRPPVPRSR